MSKTKNILGFVLLALVLITAYPASAKMFFVADKPLNITGQLSQSVQYGWHDDFDTYYGFNSALATAILEGQYAPAEDFKLYGMFVMAGDLAYELRSGGKWEARGFQASRADLEWDSDWFRVVKELHATWTPGNFMVRAGKQIVSWGEMIGFRLLDQINPMDLHRGLGDLEFETSIVPVWMLRIDYRIPYTSTWISDMNIQLLYDPRADKAIYSTAPDFGNNVSGIWAPYANLGALGIDPSLAAQLGIPQNAVLGSTNTNLEHSDGWTDPSIGIRFQTKIKESIASLNFIYGRDYNMLTVIDAAAIFRNISNLCPQGICHLSQNAFFPLRRMIGGMWATELDFLPRPGGLSAPMLRLEWAYFFRSTMLHMDMTNFTLNLEDHDDQRIAASVDFAVPIRFLNPSQMFNISAQYTLRRIAGISDGFENGLVSTEGPVNKYNHMTSLMVTTNYLTSQLTPVVIWNQDWINHSYTFKAQASYTFTSAITFIAGITLFEGSLTGRGVEPYDHKDYASFKVQYKFN